MHMPQRDLQTYAPAIFWHRFHFDAFLDRFRRSTLISYVRDFVLIHFQERFQIDAFSLKTLNE